MFIKISCLTFLTLLSFNVQWNGDAVKKITVTGIAQNAKGNATVVTAEEHVYFLYGVENWEEDYYGKRVTVSGKLKLITAEKSGEYPYVAQWVGTRKYIKKPKWVLNE